MRGIPSWACSLLADCRRRRGAGWRSRTSGAVLDVGGGPGSAPVHTDSVYIHGVRSAPREGNVQAPLGDGGCVKPAAAGSPPRHHPLADGKDEPARQLADHRALPRARRAAPQGARRSPRHGLAPTAGGRIARRCPEYVSVTGAIESGAGGGKAHLSHARVVTPTVSHGGAAMVDSSFRGGLAQLVELWLWSRRSGVRVPSLTLRMKALFCGAFSMGGCGIRRRRPLVVPLRCTTRRCYWWPTYQRPRLRPAGRGVLTANGVGRSAGHRDSPRVRARRSRGPASGVWPVASRCPLSRTRRRGLGRRPSSGLG